MTTDALIAHPLSKRSSGVLMHLSSLPSKYGIGDCGPGAFAFIDFLKEAGQTWWQMLPLGPMGFGYSPYDTSSAFAASALWVSPDALRKEGWLTSAELDAYPSFPKRRVDYAPVSREKHRLLGLAFGRFMSGKLPKAFETFEEEHHGWLEDYAVFTALHRLQGQAPWIHWPEMLRRREREILHQVSLQLTDQVKFQKFVQFIFFRQWKALKTYARENGVRLIGDMPFFITHDSADVWSHPQLFESDAQYQWDAHRQDNYAWWIQRFTHLFQLYDVVRLGHFTGFSKPGADFFKAIYKAIPHAAFIAENLGPSVPAANALREDFQIPGMSVLQFAFSGDPSKNPHLPNKLNPKTVAYTGTHDTNTIKAWFTADATPSEIYRVRKYIRRPTGPAHWQLIRQAYTSPAGTAIVPMQDLLGLGPEARMNVPGRMKGNWAWRLAPDIPLDPIAKELRVQAEQSARL